MSVRVDRATATFPAYKGSPSLPIESKGTAPKATSKQLRERACGECRRTRHGRTNYMAYTGSNAHSNREVG